MGRFQDKFTADQQLACAYAVTYDGTSAPEVMRLAEAGELKWKGEKLPAFSPSRQSIYGWAKEEERAHENGMQRLRKRDLARAIPDDLQRVEALISRDIKIQERISRAGKQVNLDRLRKGVGILQAVQLAAGGKPEKIAPEHADTQGEERKKDTGLIAQLAAREAEQAETHAEKDTDGDGRPVLPAPRVEPTAVLSVQVGTVPGQQAPV